jgi:hypothetical protein
MKISKKFLSLAMVAVIAINILSVLYPLQSKYLDHDFWKGFPALKQTYLDSQYVNKHPKGWIPDEAVNAYAGAAYVKGVSPILIAPDTPPLGRYLIGLSALLFGNENILNLFFAVGSLFMLYMVGVQIFKNSLLSLLPPLLFSFEPIFTNQIVYTPLLDIIQLFFLLCIFYFFNKSVMKKSNLWIDFALSNFFLGCFIATKFYITGITVVAALVITLLCLKKFRECFYYLLTVPIAIFVLLLSYVRVLFDNYTLLKFLGIQKYVYVYHKSQIILPFTVWPLLLFNQWYVWFGDKPVISDPQWRVSWPIITLGTFGTSLLLLFKKIKIAPPILSLILWSVVYLVFFSIGQISSRYFVILVPILYIIVIYGVREVVGKRIKRFIS